MTNVNRNITDLNPAFGLVSNEAIIYVLRFSSDSRIDTEVFCDQMQNILYDDIGSTGHFRLAPQYRKDLNERFIVGGYPEQPPQFMHREDNEVFVAFYVRQDLPDTPLSEELQIIPKELDDFCHATGFAYEQLDVRELYRDR